MALAIPSKRALPIRNPYLIAGIVAVVVAVIAGIALWQLNGDRDGGFAVRQPGLGVSIAYHEPDHVYYLVSSQEQADVVIRGEEDAAWIRATGGALESYVFDVVVVSEDAAFERELQAYLDANAIRFSRGLPEIKLVDLRDGAD